MAEKDYNEIWELYKKMDNKKFDSRSAEEKMRMYFLETMLVEEEYTSFYEHMKEAVKGVDGSKLALPEKKSGDEGDLVDRFNIKFDTPEDKAKYEAKEKEMCFDMNDIVTKYVKIFGIEEFIRRKREIDKTMKEKMKKLKRRTFPVM